MSCDFDQSNDDFSNCCYDRAKKTKCINIMSYDYRSNKTFDIPGLAS